VRCCSVTKERRPTQAVKMCKMKATTIRGGAKKQLHFQGLQSLFPARRSSRFAAKHSKQVRLHSLKPRASTPTITNNPRSRTRAYQRSRVLTETRTPGFCFRLLPANACRRGSLLPPPQPHLPPPSSSTYEVRRALCSTHHRRLTHEPTRQPPRRCVIGYSRDYRGHRARWRGGFFTVSSVESYQKAKDTQKSPSRSDSLFWFFCLSDERLPSSSKLTHISISTLRCMSLTPLHRPTIPVPHVPPQR
jgi:hypothetical protein